MEKTTIKDLPLINAKVYSVYLSGKTACPIISEYDIKSISEISSMYPNHLKIEVKYEGKGECQIDSTEFKVDSRKFFLNREDAQEELKKYMVEYIQEMKGRLYGAMEEYNKCIANILSSPDLLPVHKELITK